MLADIRNAYNSYRSVGWGRVGSACRAIRLAWVTRHRGPDAGY